MLNRVLSLQVALQKDHLVAAYLTVSEFQTETYYAVAASQFSFVQSGAILVVLTQKEASSAEETSFERV